MLKMIFLSMYRAFISIDIRDIRTYKRVHGVLCEVNTSGKLDLSCSCVYTWIPHQSSVLVQVLSSHLYLKNKKLPACDDGCASVNCFDRQTKVGEDSQWVATLRESGNTHP